MDYYSTLSTYNQWMNQKLYAVCAEIPDVDRKSDRGAFFKSIHGTLNHILVADRIWMGRFTQQPFVTRLDSELSSDFSELRTQREQLDLTIIDWAQDLTPDWLNADFTYTNSSGCSHTSPLAAGDAYIQPSNSPSRTTHHFTASNGISVWGHRSTRDDG